MQKAILSSFLSISIFCIPLYGTTITKIVFRNYAGEQIVSLVQSSGNNSNDLDCVAYHNRSRRDYFAAIGSDGGKAVTYIFDRTRAKKIYTETKRHCKNTK